MAVLTFILATGWAGLRIDSRADALPDLIIWGPSVNPSITVTTFATNDCTVLEGCSGAGTRRLLRFNTLTRNIGTADLVIGSPTNSPLFEFDPCHGHYHFSGFAEYRLFNGCGQVAVSAKRAFCLADYGRFDTNASPFFKYTCANQGIQAGWYDVYSSNTPCQWMDITGLPPGDYTLQVEVNPQHLLTESDYSNNLTNIPVAIPLLDTNTNGMGDDWEILYGVTDPNADADGDRMSNLHEYLAGTDPTNSASAFRISSIACEGNDLRVTWTTVGCKKYQLQAANGEADGTFSPNSFADIGPLFTIPGSGEATTNHLDVGAATNYTARYYRVRLSP